VAKAEENLVLHSQAFANSAWGVNGATKTSTTTTDPAGGATALTLTKTAEHPNSLRQFTSAPCASRTYTISCWLKGTAGETVRLYMDNVTNQTLGTNITLTATWALYSFTGTFNSTTASASCGVAFNSGTTATAVDVAFFQLEERSAVTAYTPTTTQPITNYVPVLLSAANNVARFDHNPVTGESLGLLIEEQRTNLLVRSEEFENTSWFKLRASISASNTVIAPDGTLTGDRLQEDTTANLSHWVRQTVSVTSGTTYTWSVYLKNDNRRYAQLTLGDNAVAFGSAFIVLDLQNGTIISSGAAVLASTISPVGNGWYRASVTAAAIATTSSAYAYVLLHNETTTTYTGDGFSGIYIWGAQLEAGAFPTSYIPTVASQVTRSADAASMTGANFSSWYRADEGTLYGEAVTRTNVAIFTAWDGTQNNRVAIASRASGIIGSSGFVIYNNTAQTAFTFTHANNNKVALAYANNDVATTLNGAAVQLDTSASIPSTNQAVIGFDGAARVTGWIRKIAYYPKRLANAELQALTQN
jgi:hypothetical protein